jgi:hypothetical protein
VAFFPVMSATCQTQQSLQNVTLLLTFHHCGEMPEIKDLQGEKVYWAYGFRGSTHGCLTVASGPVAHFLPLGPAS